jgi:CBS domain-containing protein
MVGKDVDILKRRIVMNKHCVHKSYTIKETIDIIDDTHDRVALVVNDEEKVIGTVSQGDIIRALSSGKNIYSRIDGIIQPGFLYLSSRNMEKAYSIFRKKKITLLPVVDSEYNLTDVITLEDIYQYVEERLIR